MALVVEGRTEKAGGGEVLAWPQRAQLEQNIRDGRCRVCRRKGRRPVCASKGYVLEGGVRSGGDREAAPVWFQGQEGPEELPKVLSPGH